jgi:fucose permease
MVAGNFGGLAVGTLLMCVVAFLPTYVEGAMGRSVTFAGTALASQSVSWSVGAVIAGRVVTALSYRATGIIGALMLIAGTAFLIGMTPQSSFIWLQAGAVLVGLGMGFCNQTFLLVIQGSVGWGQRGVATASLLFLRTIGQSLGAALGGALLNFGIARDAPLAGDAVEKLLDPARRMSLGAHTIAQLGAAIAGALHNVYVIAAILAALTLVMALLLPTRITPPKPSAG